MYIYSRNISATAYHSSKGFLDLPLRYASTHLNLLSRGGIQIQVENTHCRVEEPKIEERRTEGKKNKSQDSKPYNSCRESYYINMAKYISLLVVSKHNHISLMSLEWRMVVCRRYKARGDFFSYTI